MTTRTFELVGAGRLSPVAEQRVLESRDRGSASFWVDLTDPDAAEVDRWLDALEVPGLVRDLVHGEGVDVPTGVLALERGVFFTTPSFDGDDRQPASPMRGVIVRGVVVTIHEAPFARLAWGADQAERADILPEASVAGVVAALIRFLANRTAAAARRLRGELSGLAARLERVEEAVHLSEIVACEERLNELDATVDAQVACVTALGAARSPVMDLHPLRTEIKAALVNLDFLDRLVDRFDRRIDVLRARYDTRLQERSNRRLTALTVLSAVFMPLTLIAGIYGMNFERMPELDDVYAYPITLGVMAAIAAGMLLFFWRTGWFD